MVTKDINDIHRFFNPFFALIILFIGVWMGSTVNQLFGEFS
jgi:hypothetical protein